MGYFTQHKFEIKETDVNDNDISKEFFKLQDDMWHGIYGYGEWGEETK